MTVYRVIASLTAGHLMTQIPGLRSRIEDALGGVIESAVEFSRAYGHHLFRPDEPMRLRIGKFTVWYVLDTSKASARVVFVEAVPREEQAQSADARPAAPSSQPVGPNSDVG